MICGMGKFMSGKIVATEHTVLISMDSWVAKI